MDQLYESSLKMMDEAFRVLSTKVGKPEVQAMGAGYVYRYKDKSIYQAIVQKLARVVTSLQAVRLLNRAGFLQEQAALQRTIDEFEEDIAFLCFAVIFRDFTPLHQEYLTAFYEEEFDVPESAVESTQKRPMISRKKIRAFVSKDRGTGHAQSTTIEVVRTVSKTYSGYVHGASPQLMEMYYGNPPEFHLWDAVDSPFYEDHRDDLLNHYYRSILSFALAAKSLDEDTLFARIRDFAGNFAVASGRESQLRAVNET
jgi:hypothetical protein